MRSGSLTADPNPIPVSEYAEVGSTTLSWTCEGVEEVEVRLGAPDGPLVSRTGPVGSTRTGPWVSHGMTFHLQDVSGGRRSSRSDTLDRIVVHLRPVRFAASLPPNAGSRIPMRSPNEDRRPRALVAGWFSFPNGGNTAGDLLSRDLVCGWLDRGGYSYDVALAPPFDGGVDWRAADPGAYSHVVFVCGPFVRNDLSRAFLERFGGRPLVGVNLSLKEPLDTWNPFDFLLERDSAASRRPDISFLSRRVAVPIVGLVRVEPGPGGLHDVVDEAIRRLLVSKEAAIVEVDTRLPSNATGLRSAAEVEALIARADAVVTTRLHGMVLALKNSVPVLAIDPYPDGGKILLQAKTIGWPVVFTADRLDDEELRAALDYCLTEDGRRKGAVCAERAAGMLGDIEHRFLAGLRDVVGSAEEPTR